MKLPIRWLYRGLGDGLKDWALHFLDELRVEHQLSGGEGPEEIKMRTLIRYVDGIARKTSTRREEPGHETYQRGNI